MRSSRATRPSYPKLRTGRLRRSRPLDQPRAERDQGPHGGREPATQPDRHRTRSAARPAPFPHHLAASAAVRTTPARRRAHSRRRPRSEPCAASRSDGSHSMTRSPNSPVTSKRCSTPSLRPSSSVTASATKPPARCCAPRATTPNVSTPKPATPRCAGAHPCASRPARPTATGSTAPATGKRTPRSGPSSWSASAPPHAPTIAYIERRTAQGLTKREAIRCLKRYVARTRDLQRHPHHHHHHRNNQNRRLTPRGASDLVGSGSQRMFVHDEFVQTVEGLRPALRMECAAGFGEKRSLIDTYLR